MNTNLNIKTDKETKEQAEQILNEIGLTLTAAVNLFLKATVRERGIPFALKLEQPNEVTMMAIEEGRSIARDTTVKGYTNMDDLKAALEE